MNGSVQSTAENPERDVQSGEGIFPILVGGPPEFAWPYSAANRGRTTNAIQLPTGRIDVTRNRQIDHKELDGGSNTYAPGTKKSMLARSE